MSSAIDVSGVTKSYRRYRPDRPQTIQEVLARGLSGLRSTDRFWALRDVTFSVAPGRAVGIIGTNGSGKSTLLRLIGGVGKPDAGHITVTGRIGALLDLGAGFHPDLTGRENAVLAGVLNGLTRRELMRRLDHIVAFAGVGAFIDNPTRTYSSGMQMRLAFSTAVHTDPSVLLIDEVLAVGDAVFQAKCLDLIARYKSEGCSILLVSHGLEAVQDLCDDAIWLDAGRLMALGPVSEVIRKYEQHLGLHAEALPTSAPSAPRGDQPVSVKAGFDRADPFEIVTVDLTDLNGHAVRELTSGQGLRVVIGYRTAGSDHAPQVRVRVLREDGLICYDFSTTARTRGSPGVGLNEITLVIERLDLNTARYRCDVSAEGHDASSVAVGCFLNVTGDGLYDAVLNAPHHWKVE